MPTVTTLPVVTLPHFHREQDKLNWKLRVKV